MDTSHLSREMADEFAIGSLEPDAERVITLHVLDCTPCAALVRESRDLAAMLAAGVPTRPAPPRLRRKVMASTVGRRPHALVRIARRLPAAAGVAAALVAVVALTGMVMLRNQVNDLKAANTNLQIQVRDALSQEVQIAALQRRLTEAEIRSFALEAAARGDRELLIVALSPETEVVDVITTPRDGFTRAVGRMVWDPAEQRLFFVANNLAPRPAGETYQIWVNRDGRYYSLGIFNPDDTGFVRYEARLPQGLDAYESAIVTIERAGGVSDRSGPSVFVTDLSGLHRND
ncbi:MAG: hypothetical protein Kow0010_02920 [Dehalococcoidia bacterium]